MCVRYIFARNVSSPQNKEGTTDPLLLDKKNNIFIFLISNIIIPEVLILIYLVQPERLAVI